MYYLVNYQTSNYTFNKLDTSRKVNVVKGTDIQVQFISLVNNQANKTIVDDMQKKSYKRFNDFLNGKVGYNPDFANGINYIE